MNERMKLLEAVAEAAQNLANKNLGRVVEGWYPLNRALAALDALPAQPPGKMVTLAVWEHNDGAIQMVRRDTEAEGYTDGVGGWTRLGTVTLEVTP